MIALPASVFMLVGENRSSSNAFFFNVGMFSKVTMNILDPKDIFYGHK